MCVCVSVPAVVAAVAPAPAPQLAAPAAAAAPSSPPPLNFQQALANRRARALVEAAQMALLERYLFG